MKRKLYSMFAALLFIMPTFSEGIASITVTAPKNATIINDTGKKNSSCIYNR